MGRAFGVLTSVVGSSNQAAKRCWHKSFLRLTGSSSKIVFSELPSDDPKQLRQDIELARTRLSWEPKVALEDGIRHTVEYFAGIV